jgi:hypothetical protein
MRRSPCSAGLPRPSQDPRGLDALVHQLLEWIANLEARHYNSERVHTSIGDSPVGRSVGGLPSTGIPYVVVNGTIVVKGSKALKDVFPGKPIRLPVKK